ncbi:Spc97/Spc98 [Corchorus olitorius]|uniref:Spc97/Spc98 n=1 Tax=Corchorus olitorius TaxID=93759 RepID=A0A1R3H6C7_9ROSI|nr:Spc97/Spc98 [Corchorus olitorius]
MGEKKGEKAEVNFGNNSIEDVTWLCSLSESDLDFLISLKKLALKRASVIGHVQLAKKFDLKMLRALGTFFFISHAFFFCAIFLLTDL